MASPCVLRKAAWALVVVAAVGGAGCFVKRAEQTSSTSPDEVTGGASASLLLKSTLVLDAGCIATKVGSRALLLSARCVTGNDAFAVGASLGFKTADNVTNGDSVRNDTLKPVDAGSAADARASNTGLRTVTIADVQIHPSYAAKCKTAEACGFDSTKASDAADVAVVVLDADLEGLPSIPVDLDAVGESDPLFAVSSGCDIVGAELGTGIAVTRTIAVPAKSVSHDGSPYADSPDDVGTLEASYVVTPGSGWSKKAPHVCRSDFGAPLFRAGVAAVAGVTSNFTTWGAAGATPVTLHHTRVDAQSRFKIGAWLESLGAETIHSCSESVGGCKTLSYDGGMPVPPSAAPTKGENTTAPGDGGAGDAIAPTVDGGAGDDAGDVGPAPGPAKQEQLSDQGPPEDDYSDPEADDYADAAAPRKKVPKQDSGCSAAPGPLPAGDAGIFVAVGLGLLVARRRRVTPAPERA